jgi:PPM family protein phosphatase
MVMPVWSYPDERMHWQSVGLTHRGLRRPRNEDALLVRPEARLYAVADGMGGHAAGDIASRLAVDTLDAAFRRPPSPRIRAPAMAQRLLDAFERANRAILKHSVADRACSGMGTTLTAVCPLAAVPQCVIAHIGDSRAYRLRARELVQLTGDHTWVQQQVDAGMLTPPQARHHPLSSVLNRVLGTEAVGPADTLVVDVRPGDLFLLCSDGLTTMLGDDDIRGLLDRDVPVESHAHDLVESANLYGGHDNITVIVLMASA